MKEYFLTVSSQVIHFKNSIWKQSISPTAGIPKINSSQLSKLKEWFGFVAEIKWSIIFHYLLRLLISICNEISLPNKTNISLGDIDILPANIKIFSKKLLIDHIHKYLAGIYLFEKLSYHFQQVTLSIARGKCIELNAIMFKLSHQNLKTWTN